jgi:dolichol-phosphate mannosyltransferase
MTEPKQKIFQGKSGVPAYRIDQLRPPSFPLALVIPVIDESCRLTNQLKLIQAMNLSLDIIVADGGSSDGSTETEQLYQLGTTALLTRLSSGKLSAQLRMAFHHCLLGHYEGIITMDGNGKDGVCGIEKIAGALKNGYDFVQGSRFVEGGEAINTPIKRYLAIRGVHAPITSIGARHWYSDSTNGFRGHSRRLLEDPRVAPFRDIFDSYELIAYLPIRAARLGLKVTEVPVSRAYPQNIKTPTKIRGVSSHITLLRILIRACTGKYDPHST